MQISMFNDSSEWRREYDMQARRSPHNATTVASLAE